MSVLRKSFLVLCMLAISLLASVSVFADDIVWSGNGTTGGSCNNLQNDPSIPAGQQQWLFILSSPDGSGNYWLDATFNTGSYNDVVGVQQGAGTVQITLLTPENAVLISATATGGTSRSNLVVSHCSVNPPPLQVTKTASTSFTRTFQWTIDKSVIPDTLDMFRGDSSTVTYTIGVTKTGYVDSNWAVNGTISIYNPSGFTATVTGVTDDISGYGGVGVNCGVGFPYALGAGQTLNCTYSSTLPDGSTRTNTATAATSGPVPGGSGSASVDFAGASVTVVNGSINVDDTNGSSFPFGDSGSVQYNKTFTCDADEGTHNNTATIRETGQSDGASVQVNCYELAVSKDASTTFTRTYNWDITKDFDGEYSMFIGDSPTSHGYTIAVDLLDYTDSDWAVSGNISVYNPAPITATINTVADIVSPGILANVDCGVAFPYLLAAGGTLPCSYDTTLPDGSARTNTATASLQNHADGVPNGTTDFSGTANVVFGDPTTEVNKEINVTDDYGTLGEGSDDQSFGPFSGDNSANYNRDFDCPTDTNLYVEGVYQYVVTNTATIDETGDSDDATVTVNCYAPVVSKDADTSYTRTWDWTIDKTGDQTDLTLSTGQIFQTVNYTVTLGATSTDSDWIVSGIITINNPRPDADMMVSVADSLAGAVIDCGDGAGDTDVTVLAGDSASCSYSAGVGGAVDGTNTATATLNAIDFSGSADYTFGDPSSEIDECVTVSDDKVGDLGLVCAEYTDLTLEYNKDIGPYDTCGEYTFVNTATFVSTETPEKTGSDSHTVNVHVPCGGCTLTQGYWKTHSDRGPAPYDEGWKAIGVLEEETLFFKSTKTWYVVFWTPPAGNAYYNLAHQYMAAKLNILNGAASTAAVDAAIAGAEALFNAQGPGEVALSASERRAALGYASTLDSYNNGLIGPGHCNE